MKKYLFAISFFCLAFLLAAGEIVITGPGQIFVGSMVHFQFNPAQEAGSRFRWDFGDGSFKPGDWIYWQVRLLNESKQVQTTSEIASFKLSE